MMKPATGSIEEPSAPQGTTSLADLEAALRINLYTSFNILQSSAKVGACYSCHLITKRTRRHILCSEMAGMMHECRHLGIC